MTLWEFLPFAPMGGGIFMEHSNLKSFKFRVII